MSVTACSCPERDVDALHAAMLEITTDGEMCYVWGQAASRQVRDEFEQKKAIEKLEDFYDEALAIYREKMAGSELSVP
jgi:hypothetical protein